MSGDENPEVRFPITNTWNFNLSSKRDFSLNEAVSNSFKENGVRYELPISASVEFRQLEDTA